MEAEASRDSPVVVVSRGKGWRSRGRWESGDKRVAELGMSSGRGETPL